MINNAISINTNNTTQCTISSSKYFETEVLLTEKSLSENIEKLSSDKKADIIISFFKDYLPLVEKQKLEALLELNENYDKQYIAKQIIKGIIKEVITED